MIRTTKTPRELELEAELAAIGRPGIAFGYAGLCRTTGETQPSVLAVPMAAMRVSLERAKQWDVENPEKAAEHKRIAAALDVEIRRADREADELEAAERALRLMSVKLERSGAGERALEAARAPQETEAMGVVKRWLPDNSLTWLVLCGDKGVGKSVAALWAMLQVMRGGGTGARIDAAKLVRLSQFDAGAAEFAHLQRVDLLVVDDFGVELLSDYAKSRLHELFDARHEAYRRTVITSNLRWHPHTARGETTPGLEQRFGERIVDRISQAGRVSQLSQAPSLRRPGKPPRRPEEPA